MEFKDIIFERDNGIGIVTLNRPEKRNSISKKMMEELKVVFQILDGDEKLRVFILTGKGETFCAGADISMFNEFLDQSIEERKKEFQSYIDLILLASNLNKPVITALNGDALAGGCGLALIGDFTIACTKAKIGIPEINIGFTPGIVINSLIRVIGRRKTLEMGLTGKPLSAKQAYALGILTEVVEEADEVMHKSMNLAATIAAKSPVAVKAMKQLANIAEHIEYRNGLQVGRDINLLLMESEDFREGVASFLEKRTPNWKGR